MSKPLSQVRRRGVEDLLKLKSESSHESIQAAQQLVGEARDFGLNLRDFLDLAIDPRKSQNPEQYRDSDGFMRGYEVTLAALGMPVRDDYQNGVVLDATVDTFQTFPGTRALFPQVVDDMVMWRYRQDDLETTSAFVAQSRTISGTELLTTLVEDRDDDYQGFAPVAELGRIPVRTIRMAEQAVRIFKHGGGIRVSYEFQRRSRLDMLVPFQNRSRRELERSKVAVATGIMLNGDQVNPAATVVTQSSLDSTAKAGTISMRGLLSWLVSRAKAGTPVDTVIGNWDAYVAWLMLFAMPSTNSGPTDAQTLAAGGFQIGSVPLLSGAVNFALSSAMPAGKLLGISKGDTLEELIEANSDINESERAINNQSISYYRTINSGYKLAFPDTRSVYDYSA